MGSIYITCWNSDPRMWEGHVEWGWGMPLEKEGRWTLGKRAPGSHEEAAGTHGRVRYHSLLMLPGHTHPGQLYRDSDPQDWLEEQGDWGGRTWEEHASQAKGIFHSHIHSTNLNLYH